MPSYLPEAHGRVISRCRSIHTTHRIPGSRINSARWGVHQIRTDMNKDVTGTVCRYRALLASKVMQHRVLCHLPFRQWHISVQRLGLRGKGKIHQGICLLHRHYCVQEHNLIIRDFLCRSTASINVITCTSVQYTACRDLKEHQRCYLSEPTWKASTLLGRGFSSEVFAFSAG